MAIELMSYIKEKNNIEDISMDDLEGLMKSKNKIFKNFNIKIETQESIVVYNRTTGQHHMIRCVKEYFDTNNKTCPKIKDELGISQSAPCKVCLARCIEKNKEGVIAKK